MKKKCIHVYTFKAIDFIDEDSFNNNLDIYTYLALSFEKDPPIFKYNEKNEKNKELILTIKNKEDSYDFSLSEAICKDDDFWNKNIELKIKKLEDNLKSKEMEFKGINEKLKKDIQEKKQQLEQIKEKNDKLAKLNERITKSLSELEEKQKKAIEQLNQVS